MNPDRERQKSSEATKVHGRFFQAYSSGAAGMPAWYYEAREGMFGPFESRAAAEQDLAGLIHSHPWRRREFE